MDCVLGLDGGGTKTECVVLDRSGRIVARAKGPASNPTRIGFPAAFAALQQTRESAIASAGITLEVKALCAGLAGSGRPENHEQLRQFLTQEFPRSLVDVRTDLDLALAAMPQGPAIVLVVGTGSAAIGRDAAGEIKREGGLGPATSDEGSAFDVGRSAIAAVRTHDSGEQSDRLARQIFQHLGFANWNQVDSASAANPDTVYPRIFPVVAASADAGNAVAQFLLNGAAQKLATIAHRLAESLNLSTQPFPISKTGGTIGRSRFFDRAIEQELRAKLPQAIITPLAADPAEVAAFIALQLFTSRAEAAP
jgi:N-acetylglucosamine kinase-like BadF-type ATPase